MLQSSSSSTLALMAAGDLEFAIAAALDKVTVNGMTLGAFAALHDNKRVVMAAVQQNGKALMFASRRLTSDGEVVRAAVAQNGKAFYFASAELRCDKDFVLETVRTNGLALKWASWWLRRDRDVVLEAVRSKGQP